MRALPIGRILYIVLWAMLLPVASSAQDPLHRRYTMQDGLPSNKVYSITKDSQGFLWFGTDAGASRFDGSTFTNFTLQEGLTDLEVLNIVEDSKHRIWFLCLNGKLCYLQDGRVHNELTDPGLAVPNTTAGWQSLAEDVRGNVWIGGVYGGVLRLSPEAVVDTILLPAFGNMSIVHDERDSIVLFQSEVIHHLSGDRLERKYTEVRLLRLSLVPDRRRKGERPLVLLHEGIMTYGSEGMRMLIPDHGHLDVLVHRRAWRDAEGDVWVQRRHGGIDVYPFDGGAFGHPMNLMGRETVNHAFVDAEGIRWLATNEGVVMFTRSQMHARSYTLPDPDEGLLSLLLDRHGTLWAGGDRGAYRFQGEAFQRVPLQADKLGPGRILGMDEGPDGTIWLACDFTVYTLDPTSPVFAHRSVRFDHVRYGWKPIPREPVRSVLCRANGQVLAGGTGLQIVVPTDTAPVRRYHMRDSIPLIRIYGLHEDPLGRVWFEQNSVLHVIENGRLSKRRIEGDIGLRINTINSLGKDTLLLGTTGQGLVLLVEDRVIASTARDPSLPLLDVERIRVQNDTIWTAGPEGVHAFTLRKGALRRWCSITEREGLGSNDARDVVVFEGDPFIATADGATRIRRTDLNAYCAPPVPYFQGVSLNDSVVDTHAPIRFGTHEGTLRIIARAISFSARGKLSYEYRFGPDGHWSVMHEGRVDLSNMAAGAYLLEVRVRAPGSTWSLPITTDFEVVPHWYETTWAFIGFGLLGGLCIWVITALWIRQRHRRELRRLAGLQLLSEERRRIAADVHDDLGADLSHLLGQARSAHAWGGEGNYDAGEMAEGISRSMEKIDDIIWSLDPERDNVRSTAEFIENWVRTYVDVHGLVFRSNIKLTPGELPLHANRRRELALVIKEAARNIVKHAKAGSIFLSVVIEGGRMMVVLQDDGEVSPIGRTSERRSGSLNMRRRVERLGGRSYFEPVAPRGTRFIVEVDLDARPKE